MGLPLPKFTWTHSGNYPAGGNLWNSQPLSLTPAGSYFTPNTKPDAEELNYMFGTISDDMYNNQRFIGGMHALTWRLPNYYNNTTFTSGGTITSQAFMAGCWDEKQGRFWFVQKIFAASVDALQLWNTVDGTVFNAVSNQSGKPLVNITPDQNFVAVTMDPSTVDKAWLAWVDQSTASYVIQVYTWSPASGGTWTNIGPLSAVAGTARVTLYTYNGHVLVGAGTTSATHAGVNRDAALTACFTGTATAFAFADNGSMVIAMPTLTATPAAYWTSPDGVTFTAQNFSQSGGGTIIQSGDQVFGICWTQNALNGVWLLGINRGPNAVFYVSSDGINWVLYSQPSQIGNGVTMANVGASIVVTLPDAAQKSAFSIDGGGTWYPSYEAFLPNQNATTTFYCPPTVVSSQRGFMYFQSQGVRLSLLGGLPPVSLM